MSDFLEIKCLDPEEQQKVVQAVEKAIARRKKDGILKEREVREIENMELRPLPDIQDVQSVYEDFLFRPKAKSGKGGEHGR